MVRPTAADVRSWVPAGFPWEKFQIGGPADPDPLATPVNWAVGYVQNVTGQKAETLVDADLEALFQQAVTLRTIQVVAQGTPGYITATVVQDYLQSFTAGSYSETRRPAEESLRRGGSIENPLVNPWRALSDLLWLLMTPDRFDYWLTFLGNAQPHAAIFEQDFRSEWNREDVWAAPGYETGIGGSGRVGPS